MRFVTIDKGSVDADVFIEFLKRRVKGAEREIFLIVDRGSAHRAKKVSAFVQTPAGKLRFFYPALGSKRTKFGIVRERLMSDSWGHGRASRNPDLKAETR
jgi:hypothetical protein